MSQIKHLRKGHFTLQQELLEVIRCRTAGDENFALVWEVSALSGATKRSGTPLEATQLSERWSDLATERLEELWLELIGGDGERAYRAIQRLGAAGPRAAVFLKARLPWRSMARLNQGMY